MKDARHLNSVCEHLPAPWHVERENNPTINSVDSVENQAELMQTVCKEKDKKTKGAKADLKLILDAVTIECQQCRKLIKLVETEADLWWRY